MVYMKREEKIIELVSSFCDDELNDEYKELCVKLVGKLGRKRNSPLKRGKVEIWASAVVYAIGQINFLFDKASEPYATPDDICSYFNTKKSTVSNKAHEIREMCDLGHFDEEFSTTHMMESLPTFTFDENGLMMPFDPMDDYFDEVYELFEKGKIDEAVSMLDDIDEGHPEYERAKFYKAFILNATGTKDESSEIFNMFMSELGDDVDLMEMINEEIDMNDSEALLEEAIFHYAMGDFDNALHYIDSSLKISPDDADALDMKALSLCRLGKYKEAMDVIDKAIKINPKEGDLLTTKGIIQIESGNTKKALKSFDKAIKINPRDDMAWHKKGEIYFERNQYKNALKCFDKAIEIEPDEITYYIDKAKVYTEMEDYKNAKKSFKKAEEIDSEDPELLFEKGQCMLMQEKFEKAIEYYDKCLEIDGENPEVLMVKALASARLNREDDFEECMAKILMINPLLIDEMEKAFR